MREATAVPAPKPWGSTRMRPYPKASTLAPARAVLAPESRTARWQHPDGSELSTLERHKRSETSSGTTVLTSPDGNADQGSDQEGDTD